MKFERVLKVSEIVQKKSIFLLGPRQTGKSTLLRQQLADAPTWNLLDATVYRNLSSDLSSLRREILAMESKPKTIVIDEIQRIPELLNEVHLMIEEMGLRFALTGSSARALKRRGVNLLAGRARILNLHPLVSKELGSFFDLQRALSYGLLPSIYLSETPDKDLADYAGTYLKEEIAAEGLSRNIPAFSRFLEIAAISSGQQLNFTSLASDAQTKRTTIVDWFDVLKDTLIAHELPAWQESRKRKPIATSKFFLFDIGVARHLAGEKGPIGKGTTLGNAFEHFIFHELKSACDYGYHSTLHYWRSVSQFEVDFVVDGHIAIEVKAKVTIGNNDLKGLYALKEENQTKRHIVVSLVEKKSIQDGIEIWPCAFFLEQLWSGKLKPI